MGVAAAAGWGAVCSKPGPPPCWKVGVCLHSYEGHNLFGLRTAVLKALKGLKVIQNILSDAKYDVSEWKREDDQTYQERLALLNKHLDVVFESTDLVPLSKWAEDEDQVPAIICHFPLHLGTFFVERLMRKACFELEEFGGGLDFQLDNVAVLLQHVGHRLRFLDGLYDVVFACALVEQYKSVALQEQEVADAL